MNQKIIIIGAGPAGLGAAYRLQQLGVDDFLVFEKNDYVGGLSTSFLDDEGFTWDVGGHVLFSSYKEFDEFLEKMIGNEWIEHLRESWVRVAGTWVPYPFQNNIRYLPKNLLLECLEGLYQDGYLPPENFRQWLHSTFGKGISRYFMEPYNRKVWATPLEKMSFDWIHERVNVVSFEKILQNVILEKDDVSWGPNNKFKFPLFGGTGQIFRGMTKSLEGKLHLKKEVVRINPKNKTAYLSDQTETPFDFIINTSPLDLFVNRMDGFESLKNAVQKLVHNGIFVAGIGLEKPSTLSKCWMYFPDPEIPYFRVTNFSKYSPNNVPDIRNYSSLMTETTFSATHPINQNTLLEQTIKGLVQTDLLSETDTEKIVSRFLLEVPYAYPVPTLERNEILRTVLPKLEEMNIFSRGRFGAFKYEIGNMDCSFIQGHQAVNRIVLGEKENCLKI